MDGTKKRERKVNFTDGRKKSRVVFVRNRVSQLLQAVLKRYMNFIRTLWECV